MLWMQRTILRQLFKYIPILYNIYLIIAQYFIRIYLYVPIINLEHKIVSLQKKRFEKYPVYGSKRVSWRTKLSRFRIFICSVSSHAYIHLIHRKRIKRIRVSVEQICGSISAIRCRSRHLSLLARCPLHYLAKPVPSNLGRTEWRIIVAERVCPELTTRRSDVWNTVLTLANERISWSRAMAQRSRIHWNAYFVRIMKVTSVSVAKELDGGKSEANTSYRDELYSDIFFFFFL